MPPDLTSAPTISTLNDLFRRVAAAANPRAVLWQDEFGAWQPISSDQIYQRVRALAQTFLSWGAKKGDRIALISENRWEWAVTDFAVLSISAADVPIYPTLTAEQIAVLLRDAECRIAVVSTLQQYDKLNSVRAQTLLEHIVIMDSPAPVGAVALSAILDDCDTGGSERDPEFDALVRSVEPGDLATLIYTSGTTGEPKGVALTHGNIACNQNYAVAGFNFSPSDVCISFLPLSHITARALDYVMYNHGAQVVYCSQFDKLPQTMRLLAGAVALGSRHADTVYEGRRPGSPLWSLANKLVYSKVQEAFGGRVRFFISGGAPLGPDLTRWFASVGIALWEGYGLTETSPVISLNKPQKQRMGSTGPTLPNIELKFASDGELLVRGASVFSGYWKKPEANAECFEEGVWFRTGDIAHLDNDGFLFITDRKKELLKTSGGKLIAPQPIEGKLKSSPLVSQAALIGDKHKYISALISPNFAALEAWAGANGVSFNSRAELANDARVTALYSDIVSEVNGTLAKFETVKRFRVVAEEWAQETGELTPSMKLKRRVLVVQYAAVIDEIYADEATAQAE
jgi:long-chain acyl-CoA synthetase